MTRVELYPTQDNLKQPTQGLPLERILLQRSALKSVGRLYQEAKGGITNALAKMRI